MDPVTKDEKNITQPVSPVSITLGRPEGAPIGVTEANQGQGIENYVQPSSEILQPEVPQSLKQVGVQNVGLRISDSAIAAGVTPAIPQMSRLGNLPIGINEVHKLRKGDVTAGKPWEAGVEVRQVDREEQLERAA